ncbi:GGDEF domain-containing protein [Paenibacillus oenotherae]|uniref:GGDEF domain-containing protein n=1 Tax=Paenibacillus oenotherae TaxID=1435645 RepID=A0ABS7D4Y6_9BACL|nr:GGDEF domain-containing protein [Paenibacillus oenotherae]MBW7474612.1 GGDEF domain-containing protein [Paenibacillus oenotherae]
MDYETLDYNRHRWNRMLLNAFWFILLISILLESLYLTISAVPTDEFIIRYIIRPTLLQLGILLLTETGLRFLKPRYQDYVIIFASSLLASIIAYVHITINFLLIALFLPVVVSIFYFHTRKLVFALSNTLLTVYFLYFFNDELNSTVTLVGLTTITVMFLSFSLIAWGVMLRGRELMAHLKTYFESNQQLLVKTIWMDKLAKMDALTELYNHMTFHEYFEKLIEQNESNGLPLQLAILDIDNFKLVNDTYGHRAGDAVLQRVSELIRNKTCANDFVARYGGEEFAILFTDKSEADSLVVVEELRQEIASAPHDSLHGKPVTVSIGYAAYESGEGKEIFFHRVDEALYAAKSSGKNKTIIAAGRPIEIQLA